MDYLQSLPYVDAECIGAIGVCGGGAYTVHAGITDAVSRRWFRSRGVNYGRLIRESFAQFKPREFAQGIAQMRIIQAQGAERYVASLLPESVVSTKAAGITDIDVLEATEYYKTAQGQQPTNIVQRCGDGLGCLHQLRSAVDSAADDRDRRQVWQFRCLSRRLGNRQPCRFNGQAHRRRRLVALTCTTCPSRWKPCKPPPLTA